MIQFARVVGLEVSTASFGILEDLFLEANLILEANGCGGGGSGRSPFCGRVGSSVGESEACRSFYSLPTITKSALSEHLTLFSPETCSSCQADEAFSHVPVAFEKSGTDSLKTLKETKAEFVKKAKNSFRWSREGPPNPRRNCGEESGGYIFTDEMLALTPFGKILLPDPRTR